MTLLYSTIGITLIKDITVQRSTDEAEDKVQDEEVQEVKSYISCALQHDHYINAIKGDVTGGAYIYCTDGTETEDRRMKFSLTFLKMKYN